MKLIIPTFLLFSLVSVSPVAAFGGGSGLPSIPTCTDANAQWSFFHLACVCNAGYTLVSNEGCVMITQPPIDTTPTCPSNAHWSFTNFVCLCDSGYAWDSNGVCVAITPSPTVAPTDPPTATPTEAPTAPTVAPTTSPTSNPTSYPTGSTTLTYTTTTKIVALCSNGNDDINTDYQGYVCRTHSDGTQDIQWVSMKTTNPNHWQYNTEAQCSWHKDASYADSAWEQHWVGGCGVSPDQLTLPTTVQELNPSAAPSASPSDKPSVSPSASPSDKPSVSPSVTPSDSPSASPSSPPSGVPSAAPTATPPTTISYTVQTTNTGLCSNGQDYVETVYQGYVCNTDGVTQEIQWISMKTTNPNHPQHNTEAECTWHKEDSYADSTWDELWLGGCGVAPTQVSNLPIQMILPSQGRRYLRSGN